MDSATPTAQEDTSKEGKTTTHPELEMAPSVSEGEELTPEEVQLVIKSIYFTGHKSSSTTQQQALFA